MQLKISNKELEPLNGGGANNFFTAMEGQILLWSVFISYKGNILNSIQPIQRFLQQLEADEVGRRKILAMAGDGRL